MPAVKPLLPFLLAFTFCNQVAAANTCPSYLDTTVRPITIESALQAVARLPRFKDEYETSAAFQERLRTGMPASAATMLVETPFDGSQVQYDADRRTARIAVFAVDNLRTDYAGVFGHGTELYEKVPYVKDQNIDVVVSSTEKSAGSYVGANAFGARIQVKRVNRTTRAIFDRQAEYEESLFFPGPKFGAQSPTTLQERSDVSAEAARALKTTTRAVLVVRPKPPFYARGKVHWGPPTLEGPLDINETLEVLVADIDCVLLTNAAGLVHAALPTYASTKPRLANVRPEIEKELVRWGPKNISVNKRILKALGSYNGPETDTLDPEFAAAAQVHYDAFIRQCKAKEIAGLNCESLQRMWASGKTAFMPLVMTTIYDRAPGNLQAEAGKLKLGD